MSTAVVVGLIVTAVKKFGEKVFDQSADAAAEDAASLGRRLLHRLIGGRSSSRELAVQAAAEDVVAAPANPDAEAALRLKVGQLLDADPQARAAVQAMVGAAPEAVMAIGERAAAVRGDANMVITGDHVSTQNPRRD